MASSFFWARFSRPGGLRAAPRLLSASVAVSLSLAAAGCESATTDDVSSGTGGSLSSSSTTGSGSECASPADCPGTDGDCRVRACDRGFCGFANVANGTVTPGQIAGDCRRLVCDGMGGLTPLVDATDAADDDQSCTTDACDGMTPTHTPVMKGTLCAERNGAVCDAEGHCVECNVSPDCATGVCSMHFCVPPACTDRVKNGLETDTDCGGAECAPCGTGDDCTSPTDCADGVCALTCQTPTCMDGVTNGPETDKDCGGACPDCANGKHCLTGADCASAVCGGTPLACLAPSCSDALANGMESDVDCGAVCPSKCGLGKKCVTGPDCVGGSCNAVSKTCDPTCTDLVKDGSETDVDCGGSCAADCALGEMCGSNADCASALCDGGVCVDPNGCTPANATDLTAMSMVTVNFGGGLGNAYAPRCIKVSVGAKVTFSGSFVDHPLQAGRVSAGIEIPTFGGTPFPTSPGSQSVGTSTTYTMNAAGVFPYYCVPHGGGGMNGAVFVQ